MKHSLKEINLILTQSTRNSFEFWFRCTTLAAVSVIVLFASFRTSAFDPDSPIYGHTFVTKSIATNGFSFSGKSVPEFTASLTFSPNEKINFSSDAADQLVLGARSMDFLGIAFEGAGTNGSYVADEIPGGLRIDGDPSAPDAHCDDEKIVDCSRRIYKLTIKPTASNGGADVWKMGSDTANCWKVEPDKLGQSGAPYQFKNAIYLVASCAIFYWGSTVFSTQKCKRKSPCAI